MIVCAGGNEHFHFAKNIGIGMVQSAINLSELCIKDKPNKIIFIGTAGLYKEGQIFEIFESKNATNIEISMLDKKSFMPVPQEVFNDVSQETFINSSNFITINKASAYKLFELGAYAENMEFYSVLSVAKKFNIPAKGIFVATNFCNANAHEDFLQNHSLAKDILCEYVESKGMI
ncbi:MAG: purine-nucleoside phosphorylase [Campylobacter sp.]|nr:purine-nucleoside phosphorylase [Campylobacter sp.]